jgi:predicted nucleotidyltransferase
MHWIISENRDAIMALCERFNVDTLEVFGSASDEESFRSEKSDVDFLVKFRRPARLGPLEEYFGLRAELGRLLQRPIDLVEYSAVENPFVRRQIEASRKPLYAA